LVVDNRVAADKVVLLVRHDAPASPPPPVSAADEKRSAPETVGGSPVHPYLLFFLAFIGAIAGTYWVGSKGVIPAYQALKSYAGRRRADLAALEARLAALELLIVQHDAKIHQPPQPDPAPSPIPNTQTA